MNLSDRTRKTLQNIIADAVNALKDEMQVASLDRVILTLKITENEADAEIQASKTETVKIKTYGKLD